MQKQILLIVSIRIFLATTQADLPHIKASIITQAARNIHAWNPPSTGGNFCSSVDDSSNFSGHKRICASLPGSELLQEERLLSILAMLIFMGLVEQ
ncbi:hypothetical protein N7463_001210 [Penicillium fimorum]|uniref:Secreted protein n=1 Tax=Penicillium fimorum TaxID=1882269 RepID=A0A9W9Y5Q6_9EURO|nr:hypothetical protein N7463_001210 [Penicillium fimorum]